MKIAVNESQMMLHLKESEISSYAITNKMRYKKEKNILNCIGEIITSKFTEYGIEYTIAESENDIFKSYMIITDTKTIHLNYNKRKREVYIFHVDTI